MIYPLHVTRFDALSKDDKKDSDAAGEELLCAILYLENSEKYRFAYLKRLLCL